MIGGQKFGSPAKKVKKDNDDDMYEREEKI